MKRKQRAKTVQTLADTIAWAGQLSGFGSKFRDFMMRFSTSKFLSIEKIIF